MYNPQTTDERNQIKDRVKDVSANLREGKAELKEGAAEVTRQLQDKLHEGQESIRHYAGVVDKQLRKDPWPVVAGIAVGSLLIGFILGSSKRG